MPTTIIAFITETCASCGAQNRWWISRKGYGQDYINWCESALCPRCFECEERRS